MANIITGSRILFSIALLFFPTFSPAFYALYLAAGITDMIDGTFAAIQEGIATKLMKQAHISAGGEEE